MTASARMVKAGQISVSTPNTMASPPRTATTGQAWRGLMTATANADMVGSFPTCCQYRGNTPESPGSLPVRAIRFTDQQLHVAVERSARPADLPLFVVAVLPVVGGKLPRKPGQRRRIVSAVPAQRSTVVDHGGHNGQRAVEIVADLDQPRLLRPVDVG